MKKTFNKILIKKSETFFFLSIWSHRLRPKELHASVAVAAVPDQVPSQRPLTQSVSSVTSFG